VEAKVNSTKHVRVAAAVGCVALLGGILLGGGAASAAKKGKKKAPKTVRVADGKSRAIPDAVDTGTTVIWGSLATPLNVGKRFKGVRAGDVRVTLRTTGLAASSAADLLFRVTAPNGRTVTLGESFAGQSIGPLPVTANSRTRLCGSPPCADPDATLSPPYFGTVGDPNLALLEGVRVSGRWVVTVYDQSASSTSILNSVGLAIAPQ
jgi:hypothetical protein